MGFLRSVRLATVTVGALLALSVCAQDASYPLSIRALVDLINEDDIDGFLEEVNEAKRATYKGDVLLFAQALWAEDRRAYPDLKWDVAVRDVVRIEVVDILAQAKRNGLTSELPPGAHEFVRRLVATDDADLVRRASSVLSIIDDPADVAALVGVARQEGRATFRAAALALVSMCNAEAARAVTELRKSLKNEANHTYLENTASSMSEFKSRSQYCE